MCLSFQVVKIRLQLQGELRRLDPNAKIYRGILSGLYQIGRYEGIKSLQKGLGASLGLKCCQSMRYIDFYEQTYLLSRTFLSRIIFHLI